MKNVGTVDAYWRISGGLLMTALGAAAMVRRPSVTSALMVALGSLKVAEGVTRFDPMMDALGWSTVENDPLSQLEESTAGAVDWAGAAVRSAGGVVEKAVDSAASASGRAADQAAGAAAEAAEKSADALDKATETAERVARRAEEYLS